MSQTFQQMLADYKSQQQKVKELTFGEMLRDYKAQQLETEKQLRERMRPHNELDFIQGGIQYAEAQRQEQADRMNALKSQYPQHWDIINKMSTAGEDISMIQQVVDQKEAEMQEKISKQEKKEPESYLKRRGYSHMATPEEMDQFTKTTIRGITRGVFETLGSLFGTSLKYIGGKLQEEDPLKFKVPPEWKKPYVAPNIVIPLGKALETAGTKTHDYFKEKAEKIEEPEELKGKNLWDNPELMRNATWWAWNVSKMIPSFAAALIPGLGTAKFIKIFGTKIPFTAQTIPRLARFAPQLVGGTTGGFLEGASTYEEILKLGGTPEEAAHALELMTLASGALNALSLGQMLKKMPEGYKKAVIQYLTIGSMEGLTEWAEEPAEGFIKYGLGYATLEDVWEQTKRGIDVVPPAFLMGVGGTALVSPLMKEKVEAIEKKPPAKEEVIEEKEVTEPPVEAIPPTIEKVAEIEEKEAEIVTEPPPVEERVEEAVVVPPEKEVTVEAEKEEEITTEEKITAEVAEVEEVAEVKEPWEMTRREGIIYYTRKKADLLREQGKNAFADRYDKAAKEGYIFENKSWMEVRWKMEARHEFDVKQALSEGKAIPAEVLEDYPELKKIAIEKGITEVEEIAERKPEVKPKEVEKPWEMSASVYLSKIGVHEPWIAEISPWQYSNLSKRAKAEYDKKRSQEWDASAEAKQEWQDKILKAYKEGTITLETPKLHKDAREAIEIRLINEKKAKKEETFKEASEKNRISSIDEVKVGDRVFDVMFGEYGEVLKKYKKSVRLKIEKPISIRGQSRTEFTINVGRLQWEKYDDLKSRIEKEVKPVKAPSLKKPVAELKAGIKESIKALREIAKDPDIGLRIRNVNFESGYKKAKPHIDAAWTHYKAAGKGIAEFVRDMVKQLGVKFKPYLERWREDVEHAEGKSTNRQKARIHILKSDLNWSDERYRAEMSELYGVETSTKLTYEQANKFAEHLSGVLKKSVIREKIYAEAGEKSKATSYKRKKDLKNAELGIVAELFSLIDTELQLIHPNLKSALRRHIDNVNMAIKRDMEGVYPFLKATKKMSKKDFAIFDLARKNSDVEKINEFVKKYGMKSESLQHRKILDGIIQRAKEVGYDVNYLQELHPRLLKDKNGFLDYMYNTDAWGFIEESIKEKEKALGGTRTLSQDEVIRIANNVIRGYGRKITLAKPKGFKGRRIDFIDNELNQFYHDANVSLLMYIEETNRAIETRRFFGKTANKDPNIDDVDESIGKYVTDFIKEHKISPGQTNKIIGLLRSFFNYRYSSGFIREIKNLGYLTTLNDVGNAVTQIGDLNYAYYNAGFYSATKALGKAIVGKSEITRYDLGIEHIGLEFSNPKLLGKLLEKQFKVIGFSKMDNIGKETLMNGTIDRFRRTARRGTINEFHVRKLKEVFEGETDQIIKDLKSGKMTENIRFLAFYTLLDFQPVARSRVPKKYNDMPEGRIFYALKTFQLMHLDIIRREVIWDIKYGETKKIKIAAYKRMLRLAGIFVLAGMGKDEIRDFIYGRTTTLSDRVVDNLLQLVGLSRYTAWYAERYGYTSAAIMLIAPPVAYLEYPERDLRYAIGKAIKGEWGDFRIKDIASIKIVTFGKTLYHRFGKGREYIEEEKAEKEREKYIDEELRKRGLKR